MYMKENKIDWSIIIMIIIGIILLVFFGIFGLSYASSLGEAVKVILYIVLLLIVMIVGCWIGSNIEKEKLGKIKEIANRYQGNDKNFTDIENLLKEIDAYNNSLGWKIKGTLGIKLSGITRNEELNQNKKYCVKAFKFEGVGYNTEFNISERNEIE